jgi:hypothetical protein
LKDGLDDFTDSLKSRHPEAEDASGLHGPAGARRFEPRSQDFCDRLRRASSTVKTLQRRIVKRLAARFCATPPSCPEQLDQAPHLLIFLRREKILKPAKPPIDSLHRLVCLFGDCGAGRSTSIDIELVTTFSDETNWINITTVLLVGMMLVSNRSNRRERLLIIIFVSPATDLTRRSGGRIL